MKQVDDHHVLRVATSLGYFDYPRKTTLGEISKELGVSASTTNRALRRAVRGLVQAHQQGEHR